jgi:hypothetical protein
MPIFVQLAGVKTQEVSRGTEERVLGTQQLILLKKYGLSFLISLGLVGCGATLERGVGDNIIVTATGNNIEIATRKANEKADSYCSQKNQKAVYIRGATREQWDPRFVAEMVYQCGQDTNKLVADNNQKCKDAVNISELDPIRHKVQLIGSVTPTASMLSDDSYATDEEKSAIAKWIKLREICIEQDKLIRSKQIKVGLIPELDSLSEKRISFVNQLVYALYEEKITFSQFSRKRQEINEIQDSVYREVNTKFSGKSYTENDLEIMRSQLSFKIQQFSKDSDAYFKEIRTANSTKRTNKSSDIVMPSKDLSKEKHQLDVSKAMAPKKENDAVAIIVGIQNYKRLAKADFADQDASKFAEYANRALGIPKNKIKVLTDSDADQAALLKTFRNWLPLNVNKGKTEVFVFYSGHGLPSNDGKSLYFLPHGVDQDLLDETAIDQKKIVAAIQSAQPKSVTMFVDSCYSGQSRNGAQILAGAKPVTLKNSDIGYPPEFTVFTASAADQISSASSDLQHGIFSFYLMKGMEGAADINKDGNITYGEMQQYLSENVQRQALASNRVQVPQLIGDANRVLIGR